MFALQNEPERAERLLEAALWLHRAGDVRGGQILVERALALQPTGERFLVLLRMLEPLIGALPVLVEPPTPSMPAGTGAEPDLITAPYPVPATLAEDYVLGIVGSPLENLRPPLPEPGKKPAARLEILSVDEPLPWDTSAGTAPASPEVLLFWEGETQPTPRFALRFLEGPLAGDLVALSEATLHLGTPGSSACLSLLGPELVVRDNSGGAGGSGSGAAGTFVALRTEEQIDPGTCIRAGDTLFRYERFRDAPTMEAFHFLHQLDDRGQLFRTVALREDVCTVGRDAGPLCHSDDPALAPVHFELTPGPWATYLLDRTGQRPGTFVQLRPGSPWLLNDGDCVRVGEHLFRIEQLVASTSRDDTLVSPLPFEIHDF